MPFDDPDVVVLAGDWHGHVASAHLAFTQARADGTQVCVQLGDFGWLPDGRSDDYLRELSERARHAGVFLLWLDGNHDCHDQLSQLPIDPDTGLRPIAPNVWHLPRGSRWNWHGLRFLALGGATSLDRHLLQEGHTWWPGEDLSADDLAGALQGGEVDVMLTHDCPAGPVIPGRNYRDLAGPLQWPVHALLRAWAHRDQLAKVAMAVKPAHIVHGHFHVRHRTIVSCFGRDQTVVDGLDKNGSRHNLMTLSLAGAGSGFSYLAAA